MPKKRVVKKPEEKKTDETDKTKQAKEGAKKGECHLLKIFKE